MQISEENKLFDNPELKNHSKKTILGDTIKFYGSQKFTLANSFIEVNPLDKKIMTHKSLLHSIFQSQWITGKTVLDVNARNGFYSLWAMQKGVKSSTALEDNQNSIDLLNSLKTEFDIPNLLVESSSIKNNNNSYDLVFAPNLLDLINYKHDKFNTIDELISNLSELTNQVLIIEWVEKDDFSLNLLFNSTLDIDDYNFDNFYNSLKNTFELVKPLGDVSAHRKLFIAYKSAEIETEISKQPLEMSLQEIFASLNEANSKYLILKNWEIITEFNDTFNDLTIDILSTKETKALFESKIKNINLENKDGHLSYKFHLGEAEGEPINLYIRFITDTDKLFSEEYLNSLYNNRIKEGAIYRIDDNSFKNFIIFYNIYFLGGLTNESAKHSVNILNQYELDIKISSAFNLSHLHNFLSDEWKLNNRNDFLSLNSLCLLYPIENVIFSKFYQLNEKKYLVRIYSIEENGKKYLVKQAKHEIIEKEFQLYSKFAPNSLKSTLEIKQEKNYSLLKMDYDENYHVINDEEYYTSILNFELDYFDENFIKKHIAYTNPDIKTVVLLGMHRSGTSVTMSILEELGVFIGDNILGKNDSNPLGHFEDLDFINLNDKILKAAKGDWDNPPSLENILEVEEFFEEEIKSLIRAKNLNVVWGWKDPRTCLTLPLFLKHLKNYKLIVIERDNQEIANSLSKRNGFPIEFSLDLIHNYKSQLQENIKDIEGENILNINFEELKENKINTIKNIVNFLDLGSSASIIEQASELIVDKKPMSKDELIVVTLDKIKDLLLEENFQEALSYVEIAIDNISKNLISSTNLMYIKALCQFRIGELQEAADSVINELILNPNNEIAAQLQDQILHELKKDNIDNSYDKFKSSNKKFTYDLTIIIPVYNKKELTNKCLNSLFNNLSDRITYEVIVVDNASENIAKLLEEFDNKYVNFKFIRNETNLGFAKANNQAIDLKTGRDVLLLNNDTEITQNSIESMYNKLNSNSEIGVVGACLLYPNSEYIQHLFIRIGTEDGQTIAPYHPYQFSKLEDVFVSKINECSAVTGAAMMISDRVIKKIGLLDENYINGLEDVDYCFKAKSAGFKIIYNEESIIYHHESATTGRHDNDIANWQRLNQKWLGKITFDESQIDTISNVKEIKSNQKIYEEFLKKKQNVEMDNLEIDTKDEKKYKVDFSIIIPVKDNLEYTKKCIESVYQTSALYSIEIIIIDNDSKQETKNYLNKISDLVKVITNNDNNSFSKANNQGAEIAEGKYLIFLNNDTEVKENWLENLEAKFNEDKNIGIQGAKLTYPNGKIQHAGIVYGTVKEGLNLHYHLHLAADFNDEKVNKQREFQMVTGALLAISKSNFDNVGGFDENYYFGYEDLDLCLQLRKAGLKVIYNPLVEAVHFESITKKQEGIEKFERFIENPNSTDAKNHQYFHQKWGNFLELDAEKYYIEDKLYGLVQDKTKFKIFEEYVRNLFDLLVQIPENRRNQIGSNVSNILFDKPNVDYISNKALLFSVSITRFKKAINEIETALNTLNSNANDDKKLNILMTMWEWEGTGGGTTFPNSIANKFSELGHSVWVIFAAGNHQSVTQKYYVEETTSNGVKLIGIYNRKNPLLSASDPENEINDPVVSEIYTKYLDKIKPDIVHFHNFLGLSFNIAKITKKHGYKSFFTPHNYHILDPKLYMIEGSLEPWKNVDFFENSTLPEHYPDNDYNLRLETSKDIISNDIDLTFAVSNRQRELFIDFGINPDKITVINQIPRWLDAFLESKDIQKISQNKQIHKPLRIGYIGGLMSHKGVHNLIAASKFLNPDEIEIIIYGYGSSDYISMLENIDTNLNVTFKGEYQSYELPEIETELDMVVLPSLWEDCAPLTISECLAMQLPVIAPNIGGFTDFISDGFNGHIYNNINELTEILEKYSKSPNDLNAIRLNCSLPYGFKDYINHILDIYHSASNNQVINPNNTLKLFLDSQQEESIYSDNNNTTLSTTEENNNASIVNDKSTESNNKPLNRLSFDKDKVGGYYNKEAIGKMPYPLPAPLKLNLGCGKDIQDGFVNIDLFSENPSVVNMDIRKLNIEDNSVDLIYANDILEHFSHRETTSILTEWARVLKPNSEIIIRCPNLRLQIEAYMRGDWDADIASFMIFGGQSNPGDYHCIGFDEKSIRNHLSKAGFEITSYQEHDFPQDKGFINLNMTVRAKKIAPKSEKPIKSKTLTSNVVRTISNNPQLNIVWEGSQFQYHSLALINREICNKIIESNQAELTIVPYGEDTFEVGNNTKYQQLKSYDIRYKKDVNEQTLELPYNWIRHQWPPDKNPPSGAKWIIMQPWEYTKLPQEFVDFFKDAHELWTPSNYSRQAFVNSGIDFNKVQVIPNGIDPELFTPKGNKFKLNSNKKIKFLFVGGTIARKGIDLLLKSYVDAFSNKDDVSLIIKDMGGNTFYKGQTAQNMIKEIQNVETYPEIEYINTELNEEEMISLYRACDVFVSTYRGEGFSMPTLEAMACGLPVVVTDGGATDDFVDNTFAWKIKSEKVGINKLVKDINFAGEAHWLQPNMSDITKTLQDIYNNPSSIFPMGLQASYNARTKWTWRNTAIKMFTRLDQLNDTEMAIAAEQNIKVYNDDYIELGKAETLFSDGKLDEAIAIYEKLLDNNTFEQNIKTYIINAIAFIYIELQDFKAAIELINNNIKNDNPDSKYIKAKAYLFSEDYSLALEELNPVLESWNEVRFESKFALTLDHLLSMTGDILLSFQDIEGAEQIYNSAIQINSNNTEAIFGKAIISKFKGEREESIKLFEQILVLEPNNENAKIELEELTIQI